MNYRLHRQGVDLGVFPLEELRRRRQAGELAGDEYVLAEGAPAWEFLDAVLQRTPPVPPPLPAAAVPRKSSHKWVWIVVAIVGCLGIIVVAAGLVIGFRVARAVRAGQPLFQGTMADPVSEAGKPVPATNSLTEVDARELAKQFRIRQWVEGYQQRGQRDQPCDAEALQMLEAFIAYNYGGGDKTNLPALGPLCDKLAAEPGCNDPLVLAIAGIEATDAREKVNRYDRALAGFDQSHHRAYPKFYAAILLADEWSNNGQKRANADAKALAAFPQMLKDGSILPEDQAQVAEILIGGWGYRFFERNHKTLPNLVPPGKTFEWLRQVLEGEGHIIDAWRFRGGGYVDTVTMNGRKGFEKELILARSCFTKAYELQPRLPLAPCRMIYVSLGNSGISAMREWFDRTTAIQIDYPRAWSDMRWGLRPRWYGNEAAMLAFGATALNTGRFDTDVPRKLFDSLSDIESEAQYPPGQHIYGRPDVWPLLQQMYEGYIAEPSKSDNSVGWRSTYATIAYIAGKYDISRAQFEAVHWKPRENNFSGYGVDLSLMPLEVAARTGPAQAEVSRAEDSRAAGELKSALRIYENLSQTNSDARTREFVSARLASLGQELGLQNGGWMDFLPTGEKDPNWVYKTGALREATNGTLEIESDANGHFLFSHTRFDTAFEVKGEFEIVQSTARAFQVGLIMGLPEPENRNWFSFRIRRNETQGDFATYSQCWYRTTNSYPVRLHDGANSFAFRLQDGKATASVNGMEIFHAAAAPAQIAVPEGQFFLGLGGHSEKNETILIRYQKIQVRRL